MTSCKKYSFLGVVLAFFLSAMPPCLAGTVILLYGPSSTGKSSIAQSLQQTLSPEKVEVLSTDRMYRPVVCEMLRELGFPQDLCFGSIDLSTLGWFDLYEIVASKNPEMADGLGLRTQKKLYEKIRHYGAKDTYVILDEVICEAAQATAWEEALNGLEVKKVLVYCSPGRFVERLLQRNEHPERENHRFMSQPFYQFFNMFKKRETGQGITETNAHILHDLVQTYFTGAMDSEHEQEGANRVCELFKSKFACNEPMIEIAPEAFITYDIMIDSSDLSPEACAGRIIEYLNLVQ